jgi:hypothetical protein
MDFPLLILFDIKYKNRICTFKVHKNLNWVEDLDFLRVASGATLSFLKNSWYYRVLTELKKTRNNSHFFGLYKKNVKLLLGRQMDN